MKIILDYAADTELTTKAWREGMLLFGISDKKMRLDQAGGVSTVFDISEGGYVPPVDGIPLEDLESAVQESLGLANSALQSFTETDPTVPNWAKEPNKPEYTASEVGAATAIHMHADKANDADVVKLTSDQTIAGAKTFTGMVKVPNKTTAVANDGTLVATEAQVYAVNLLVDNLEFVKNVAYNDTNGDVTFTYKDNSTLTVNVFAENLAQDIEYDSAAKELVITKRNGTTQRISVADLVDIYTGHNGAHIQVTVGSGNVITAILKAGTVSENELTSALLGKINGAYQKPSGGIPKIDLESAVQASLAKADTALQEGAKGDKGDTGATGATGAKGDKGDTGRHTFSISATTSTTAQVTSNASGARVGDYLLATPTAVNGTVTIAGTARAAGTLWEIATLPASGNITVTARGTIQGATGATGAVGAKGDTGAQGVQGLKGDTGAQGVQGSKGDTGAQGAKGDTGATGTSGAQGVRGRRIFAVTATTTTTANVNANASGAEVGDMLLAAGTSNVTIAGTARTPGTLLEINTLPASGNITVTARGDIRGAQGTAGTKGDKGDTGAQGVQGLKGDTGAKGDTGTQGIQGNPGATGAAGAKGAAFYAWNTASNLTNISSISGMAIGDYVVNTGTASRTILGVTTAIGDMVRSTSATAGTASGNIRGAAGTTGTNGTNGAEGLSIWTSASLMSTGATSNVVPSVGIADAGRSVKVNDLVISTNASSLGYLGRVTAVASQASVSVLYLANLRGPQGTQGIPGQNATCTCPPNCPYSGSGSGWGGSGSGSGWSGSGSGSGY